jgi:hypothetical protein
MMKDYSVVSMQNKVLRTFRNIFLFTFVDCLRQMQYVLTKFEQKNGKIRTKLEWPSSEKNKNIFCLIKQHSFFALPDDASPPRGRRSHPR